jgi:hypothetical protein
MQESNILLSNGKSYLVGSTFAHINTIATVIASSATTSDKNTSNNVSFVGEIGNSTNAQRIGF